MSINSDSVDGVTSASGGEGNELEVDNEGLTKVVVFNVLDELADDGLVVADNLAVHNERVRSSLFRAILEFLDDIESVSSSHELGGSSVNGDNSSSGVDRDSLRSVLEGDGGFAADIRPGFALTILVKRGGDVDG